MTITEFIKINDDFYIQEIFCVCCNDKIAYKSSDFKGLVGTQDSKHGKINGFDVICHSCVQKLRKGMRLMV